MPEITYSEIRALPTISQGHFSNLKIDTGTMRVWLSRCGLADGETQPVQVERLVDGVWTDITGEHDGRPGASSKVVYLDGECAGLFITCITREQKR